MALEIIRMPHVRDLAHTAASTGRQGAHDEYDAADVCVRTPNWALTRQSLRRAAAGTDDSPAWRSRRRRTDWPTGDRLTVSSSTSGGARPSPPSAASLCVCEERRAASHQRIVAPDRTPIFLREGRNARIPRRMLDPRQRAACAPRLARPSTQLVCTHGTRKPRGRYRAHFGADPISEELDPVALRRAAADLLAVRAAGGAAHRPVGALGGDPQCRRPAPHAAGRDARLSEKRESNHFRHRNQVARTIRLCRRRIPMAVRRSIRG